MANNRAFTSDFVSGLRAQRDPDAAWKRRMQRLIQRRAQTVNSMPHIRMYVSPWFMDADGLMTRHAYQMPRNRPAVAMDEIYDAELGGENVSG